MSTIEYEKKRPALTELHCKGGCKEVLLTREIVTSFTCAKCVVRLKNIADTGSADHRRVWRISRRERKRLLRGARP